MRIYLASRFEEARRLDQLAEVLELNKHKVVLRWWRKGKDAKLDAKPDDEWYNEPRVRATAKQDFDAVKSADVLVLLAPESEPCSFNGANIEVGYALGLHKTVFSLGRLQQSAMYVPVIRCKAIGDLIEALELMECDRWLH